MNMSLLTQTQPHVTTCNSYKLWAMSLTTLGKSCSNFNNIQFIVWQGKEKQKKEILFKHTLIKLSFYYRDSANGEGKRLILWKCFYQRCHPEWQMWDFYPLERVSQTGRFHYYPTTQYYTKAIASTAEKWKTCQEMWTVLTSNVSLKPVLSKQRITSHWYARRIT